MGLVMATATTAVAMETATVVLVALAMGALVVLIGKRRRSCLPASRAR